jgi:nucleotide-binding universal stress UspA family protein
MADISGWVGAQPYGAQLEQFRELLEKKGEAIIAAFDEQCEKKGLKYETWMKMGHPAQVITEEESRAELLVLGQKGEHADWIGEMMGSNVERIVRQSVQPCLVTPEAFDPIKHILMAYDGSAHSSQALHVAIEMAQALDIKLTLMTVCENGDSDRAKDILQDAQTLAEAHECKVETLLKDGIAEEVILETAREKACNLIVVGAYGHTRIREMILGSTTTYLVCRSEMPVLLVR